MKLSHFIFIFLLLAGCRTPTPLSPASTANAVSASTAPASPISKPVVRPVAAPPMPPAHGAAKTPAVAVSAAPLAVAVRQPQAVTVPSQYLRPVVLGFDLPGNNPQAVGVAVYAGNQSGLYLLRQAIALTNTATFNALDMRLPWFFAAATITASDTVKYYTNAGHVLARTNYLESPLSNEAMLVNSNELPHLSVAGGVATVLGYGSNGVTYSVWAASNVAGPWNPVYSLAGTNGPWVYTEPINGTRFLKTMKSK